MFGDLRSTFIALMIGSYASSAVTFPGIKVTRHSLQYFTCFFIHPQASICPHPRLKDSSYRATLTQKEKHYSWRMCYWFFIMTFCVGHVFLPVGNLWPGRHIHLHSSGLGRLRLPRLLELLHQLASGALPWPRGHGLHVRQIGTLCLACTRSHINKCIASSYCF